MEECMRNIELFFLLNRLIPDFRTIADFRKENRKAIADVFQAFVAICLKLNLYEKTLIAIDGTKVRAVNAKANAYNKETLRKKLARIDEHISTYLQCLDDEDQQDDTTHDDHDDDASNGNQQDTVTKKDIQAVVRELQERKDKYEGYLKELIDTDETQKLTTDPEARVMHSKDGFHCAYNIQSAVDAGSHLIASYSVTNCCTDQGLLTDVAKQTKKALSVESLEVVADKGYESRKDILNCLYHGIMPNVAMKYDKTERLYNIPYHEAIITPEDQAATDPKTIKKCLSAGVLPDCYANTALSIDVQEQNHISCFIRHDDNTVSCPMGHTLNQTKIKGTNRIYANKDACRQCPNRCTSGSSHKTVSFGPNTVYVPVKMFGSATHPLQPIPQDVVQHTNYNNFHRKNEVKKKVVLHIKEDRGKLEQRKCTVEHPFGTIKWYHGAHYVLCKGKEKVAAEIGLSFLAYNLKRAINMVGTKALIEAIQG